MTPPGSKEHTVPIIRCTDIVLRPGNCVVGTAGRVRTLLGSCVSVTLWHPFLRVGAINHFLLWSRAKPVPAELRDGRYGDEAMALITSALSRYGVRPGDCEGKIFGGGNMFPDTRGQHSTGIGRANGESAKHWLTSMGVNVVSEDLFGDGHRMIIFDLETGDVLVRKSSIRI